MLTARAAKTVRGFISALLLVPGILPADTPLYDPGVNAGAERILVLAIDSIPYDVARGVKDSGTTRVLEKLRGPAALISTFPSSSYVAWGGILEPFGVRRSLGYEARYFNRETGRATGGLSPRQVPAPWKDFFNWKLEGLFNKAVAYGWPARHSLEELQEGLAAFAESRESMFALYVVSTDGLGHIGGPDKLEAFLLSLDKQLYLFRKDHPKLHFRTVLLSDHGLSGGSPLINIWPSVADALSEAGLHVGESLVAPGDIATISYGLLGSFAAYTVEQDSRRAAEAIVAVQGVDFCVMAVDGEWQIFDYRGIARITRRRDGTKTLWSYTPESADPLDYAAVVELLRAQSGDRKRQFFPDAWWFDITRDHQYPDALYRLARGFDLTRNPASILCSVAEGHMFGARKTQFLALPAAGELQWTHGSLRRSASLGFLMTDLPGWDLPPIVRFNQALLPLAPRQGTHVDINH